MNFLNGDNIFPLFVESSPIRWSQWYIYLNFEIMFTHTSTTFITWSVYQSCLPANF
jgi:hypothetical protein